MKTTLTIYLALLTAFGVSAQNQASTTKVASEITQTQSLSHSPLQKRMNQKRLNEQMGNHNPTAALYENGQIDKLKMMRNQDNSLVSANVVGSKPKSGKSDGTSRSTQELECLQTAVLPPIPLPDFHAMYTSDCEAGFGTMTVYLEESDDVVINTTPVFLGYQSYDESYNFYYSIDPSDVYFPGDTVVIDSIPVPEFEAVFSQISLYDENYQFFTDLVVTLNPCDTGLELEKPFSVEISEINCLEGTYMITFNPSAAADGFNLEIYNSTFEIGPFDIFPLVAGEPLTVEVGITSSGNPDITYFISDADPLEYNYSQYYDGNLVVMSPQPCVSEGANGGEHDEICEALEIGCGTTTSTFSGASRYNWDGYDFPVLSGPTVVQWFSFTPEASGVYNIATCGETDDENPENGTKTDMFVFKLIGDTLLQNAFWTSPSGYPNCSYQGDNIYYGNWAANYNLEEGGTYILAVLYDGGILGDMSVAIACPVYDCTDLQADFGDSCDDGDDMTENDMVNDSCTCTGTPIVTSDCEDYSYYLADHAAADGISDIYEVALSGSTAVMTYIATSDIEVHIAFNADNNLLYAVSKHTNSYRTLDPADGTWGPTVMLGANYGEITAAVFAPNGKLLIGSQNQNAIYSVNVATNVVSSYDTYSPVTGGDFAFGTDGMLYMASRSGNGIYEVYPAPVPDVLLGNVPIKVTGLAMTDSDQLLLSAQGKTSLELYNTDGSSAATSYSLELDGVLYTLRDGDMASGCNTREIVTECENFTTFYVNHGPDVVGSDLYTVDFVGGNAELNLITNVDFEAHIGYNSDDELMYFVNKDGSIVRIYNVATDTYLGDLNILGGISQLTAVEYNPADGMLYVGDAGADVIARIDLVTGIASYYANAPVFGGDLTLLNSKLYLARRSLSELYEVIPYSNAVLIGSIPEGVNGMAPSPNAGNLITSSAAEEAFVEISAADGSSITTWPATLGGNPFTFINGDMASGCIDDLVQVTKPIANELQGSLSAFPNPTSGSSQVVFTTGETGSTLIEVYDMSGRNIATLFNQVAQQGQEYRLDFNGADLPNGVYIYRMTTKNETIIEKFMIAK